MSAMSPLPPSLLRGALSLVLLVVVVATLLTTTTTTAAAALRVEPAASPPTSDAEYRALLARRIAALNPRGEAIRVRATSSSSLLRPSRRDAAGVRKDVCDVSADANALPYPVGQQTMVTLTTSDGSERHMALYIPRSYGARRAAAAAASSSSTTTRMTPMALLVLFHGLNDECARFMNNTGLLDAAERDGFVVASACGSTGWLGVAWNAGMCCGFFGDKPDDVGFARDMVHTLRGDLCLHEDKVAAVGFSNGAMLAEVLACRAADTFAAVASVGGVVEMRPGNAEGLRACDAAVQQEDEHKAHEHKAHEHKAHEHKAHEHKAHEHKTRRAHAMASTRRASVLAVHGDADEMVPWGGNRVLGFPSMEQNLQAWVARNGCDAASPQTTINNTGFINTLYAQCRVNATRSLHHAHHRHHAGHVRQASASTTSVELVRAYGGAHTWPETNEFATTDYILAFVQRVFGGW